jgi:hypothetical protein
MTARDVKRDDPTAVDNVTLMLTDLPGRYAP